MTWPLTPVIACLLAFWLGYSVNQASTCLVAAARELQHRRPPRLLVGLLAASATAGLIAVPLAWSGVTDGRLAASAGITVPLLAGSVAFGIGALINDACLLGSLHRFGCGELRLLLLPLGLAAGFVLIDEIALEASPLRPSILTAPSMLGVAALAAFLIVTVLALIFISRHPLPRSRSRWPLGISMLVLGVTGGALYVIAPMWTYADLVQHSPHLATTSAGETLVLTAAASIGGAIAAAFRQRKWRLQPPALADMARSFAGGVLMGAGVALIPSGNDSLILAEIPALSPGGAAAYLLMTATIVVGLVIRAKIARRKNDLLR